MAWRSLLPVVAFAILLLGACGGGASPTAPSPQEQEAAGQSTGRPIDGGTLLRLWSDPPTLDPHLTADATSATIVVEVFGGLVGIDSSDPDLKISADLAETWTVDPDDATKYTFYLRKDATFHDGKPVTAQDFKWSLERAADPATDAPVAAQYLGDIVGVKEKLKGEVNEVEGVRVIDEHTLEITIDSPKAYFLAKLTYPTSFVLDRENVESGPEWYLRPNGTGPFKLDRYVPGESLVLARNEAFHLGAPHLEKVNFILGGGAPLTMYENGEIHLTGLATRDLEQILDSANPLHSNLKKAPPTFSTYYIGMNVEVPPFDDPKVRQAFNYAVDKEEIARDVMEGRAFPAKGVLPPGFPGYNPDLAGYEYNPEKARRLLEESKYGADLETIPRVRLTTVGSFGSGAAPDLEQVLAMWRQNLGIDVQVETTSFATYLDDLIQRRLQIFEVGWLADYPDPENFLDLLFHSNSSNNHTGYSNPQVDQLLERARVELQTDVRYDLYHRVEELILNDAPWVPMWNSGDQYLLVKPYVQDFYLGPLITPKLRFVYMTEQ